MVPQYLVSVTASTELGPTLNDFYRLSRNQTLHSATGGGYNWRLAGSPIEWELAGAALKSQSKVKFLYGVKHLATANFV
jgi:hypothetical protein